MDRAEQSTSPVLVYGLLLLGIVARLVPHPWNATPLIAIALFGGTHLSKRWAIVLPLVIVAASDIALGWHSTIPFTWGAFAATGMLAWWVRSHPSTTRIAGGSLAGSALFFLVTNFGVWLTQELYPHTMQGLWQCYIAGLPFFRNALLGDFGYTAALFGLYALVTARRPATIAAR